MAPSLEGLYQLTLLIIGACSITYYVLCLYSTGGYFDIQIIIVTHDGTGKGQIEQKITTMNGIVWDRFYPMDPVTTNRTLTWSGVTNVNSSCITNCEPWSLGTYVLEMGELIQNYSLI